MSNPKPPSKSDPVVQITAALKLPSTNKFILAVVMKLAEFLAEGGSFCFADQVLHLILIKQWLSNCAKCTPMAWVQCTVHNFSQFPPKIQSDPIPENAVYRQQYDAVLVYSEQCSASSGDAPCVLLGTPVCALCVVQLLLHGVVQIFDFAQQCVLHCVCSLFDTAFAPLCAAFSFYSSMHPMW